MNCLSGIDCQPSKRCPILLAASHHTVRLTDQEIPIPVEPRHEHSTLRRLNSSRLCADGAMPRQWNHEGRDEHEGISHGTTSRGRQPTASRLLSPLRDRERSSVAATELKPGSAPDQPRIIELRFEETLHVLGASVF